MSYVDKLKQFHYNTAILNAKGDDAPKSDTRVTIGGMLSSTVNKMTKKGNAMGTAVLEDLYGSIEIVQLAVVGIFHVHVVASRVRRDYLVQLRQTLFIGQYRSKYKRYVL